MSSLGYWLVLVICSLWGMPAGGCRGWDYISALGDPGMRRDELRVAFEGWNFCNEVGQEAPAMGSPRVADCFDLLPDQGSQGYKVHHIVNEEDNKLGVGKPMKVGRVEASGNVDLYAVEKEVYLGDKCQVRNTADGHGPWQFWMVMLKNGNLDTTASLCPENGKKVRPFPPEPRFPCFGKGCMNQPLVFHKYTTLAGNSTLRGGFYGTYDLDVHCLDKEFISGKPSGHWLQEHLIRHNKNRSFYSVTWTKEIGKGGWTFHHYLRTSKKYPWLMLYLRSDATRGLSGGYHYPTRGMTRIIPESPHFNVRVTLDIRRGGGDKSQFYLMDMGGCWKNDGRPCDGDVATDVTRYSEMILNPNTTAWCRPDNLDVCPPYHRLPDGTAIHRNDTEEFPYGAYHMYCSPGNAQHLEEPYNLCDAYSNPQPQEIMQILPHPAWGAYGYPTEQGQGWIGDPRTWELDVGRLSQALFFYQDPGTPPVKRKWTSLDVGTEIYVDPDQVAEWTLSDFDVLVPRPKE